MGNVALEEIGDDEDYRVLVEHPRDIIDGPHHIGSLPDGLEREQITNDPEHVTASLARGNDVLDAVSEEKNTDAVIVSNRGHCQHRRQLARQLALEPSHRS